MRITAAIILPLLALAALASGCSDSKGGTSTAVVNPSASTAAAATASAENFDPNVFSAIVLQPAEVPAGLPLDGSFGIQYGGDVISYVAIYGNDSFSITSTIGHASAGATIDEAITRLRRYQSSLIKGEKNYTIDGADQAFSYSFPQTLSAATLVLKDGYFISTIVSTSDNARADEARNQENLDRYTKLALDRLKAYLADPSSVTPATGAPRYGTPTASP